MLSFQHVFAMFGATILVPLILGMPVSVALFASGIGTLIYQVATQFKVPVYLGSSFAYISAMALAIKEMGGDISAAQTGIFFVGMWLMAKRKLENWILWIIGDLVSIPLYFYRGYTFTSMQYAIFTIIAVYGYLEWKKNLNK